MEQKQKFLTRREVEKRVGHSCSWIYSMVAKGAFPAPYRLSGTSSVRWLETEIDEFFAAQIRRNKEARARRSAAALKAQDRLIEPPKAV